jgi:hypothetical protein
MASYTLLTNFSKKSHSVTAFLLSQADLSESRAQRRCRNITVTGTEPHLEPKQAVCSTFSLDSHDRTLYAYEVMYSSAFRDITFTTLRTLLNQCGVKTLRALDSAIVLVVVVVLTLIRARCGPLL